MKSSLISRKSNKVKIKFQHLFLNNSIKIKKVF